MNGRARVVIVEDGKVLVMKRVRADKVYYVFPGGGIENGETPEEAAIREAKEETGLDVKIQSLLITDDHDAGYGSEPYHFFICDCVGGELGTGTGPEYQTPEMYHGSHEAIMMPIEELRTADVRPQKFWDIFFQKFGK